MSGPVSHTATTPPTADWKPCRGVWCETPVDPTIPLRFGYCSRICLEASGHD